jgi:hypothetical protein
MVKIEPKNIIEIRRKGEMWFYKNTPRKRVWEIVTPLARDKEVTQLSNLGDYFYEDDILPFLLRTPNLQWTD